MLPIAARTIRTFIAAAVVSARLPPIDRRGDEDTSTRD
jgi:hypothetical protein